LTRKQDQRALGNTRLTAATSARSAGLEPWSWGLAAQDGELVAEHQDLKVFGGVAAGEQHQHLHGAAHHEVRELR
jgi:hypothetical protein